MPESHGLSPQVIRAFKENLVWDEIWKRMKPQLDAAMDLAIDESNQFEAGRYRALQTIRNLPDQLLQEIDDEESALKKVVKRVAGVRRFL